ncbi:MAG TPA: tRNA (adenosine(37)-N6)-threonylcarbamoyltransferase complex dimerization subunit type 1 TsaB [Candidatus Omnitrophota bacterium]|nr:tRNA (adenosine(37)-N6)-threonylcarbamoyltransferase complex dimerization subunit type 1 TsaB [Candidatus Omnitrophota bacterium]HQO57200.1 tRNA (adenosine(37)-N6)-threonylcarbamoyltransferase complex dimerization subunit type 1 TsaB [Candidatus Omnitrophota bacterium]HQP12216.1 tRNA (adenosine(37)-N6)-threonylcarbamoyltransferase complex dimerization subunit type 1 TsaB [Candidatus Omnitrophota bacterium]
MSHESYLLMDTSTRNLSLAVSRAGAVVRFRNVKLDKVLSSSIVPCIDRLLKQAGLRMADVSGFGIGTGPGSFTSLRVGLATVKAFCLASGKPVVGVPSLDILAQNVSDTAAPFIATLVDARRDLVYACLYQVLPGGLKRVCPYLLTGLDDFLPQLKGETVFVGDALPLYQDRIEAYAGKERGGSPALMCHWAPERMWFPRAHKMLPLVSGRLLRGETDDPDTLVPLYLYPEHCQVRR